MLSLSVVQFVFLLSVPETPEDAGDIRGDFFDPLFFFGPVRRVKERVERLFLTESLFYADLLPRFRWVLAFTKSVLGKSRDECQFVTFAQDGDMHFPPCITRAEYHGTGGSWLVGKSGTL